MSGKEGLNRRKSRLLKSSMCPLAISFPYYAR
jgi:hypothetical protein